MQTDFKKCWGSDLDKKDGTNNVRAGRPVTQLVSAEDLHSKLKICPGLPVLHPVKKIYHKLEDGIQEICWIIEKWPNRLLSAK